MEVFTAENTSGIKELKENILDIFSKTSFKFFKWLFPIALSLI